MAAPLIVAGHAAFLAAAAAVAGTTAPAVIPKPWAIHAAVLPHRNLRIAGFRRPAAGLHSGFDGGLSAPTTLASLIGTLPTVRHFSFQHRAVGGETAIA